MGRRMTSPVMVGRAGAVARLTAAFASSRAGEPRHVVIGGEAGIGKTRLLSTARERVEDDGARVLVGACAHFGEAGLPFAPYTEIVRSLVAQDGVPKVVALAGRGADDLARLVPVLAADDPPALQESWTQSRLQEAFLALFRRLAHERPLVMMLEDLHWADAGTLAATAVLMRVLEDDPVSIAATYRSDDLAQREPLLTWMAETTRLASVERLDLEPLDLAETTELVRHLVDGDVSPARMAQLHERSDGNPFFVEELIAAADDRASLTDSLRTLLLARVAAVAEEPRRWLQLAAIGGRAVDHDLLIAVGGASPVAAEEALSKLIEAGLLTMDPDGDRDLYRFRHALLQEAVYETIPAPVGRRYHLAYGEALSSREPESVEQPRVKVELAHHWREARDPRALPASIKAGDAAAAAYSFDVAFGEYEQALNLWGTGDDRPSTGLDRAELLRRTSESAFLAGESDRGVEACREAIDELGEADRVRATELRTYQAQILWMTGEWSAGIAANLEALEMAPPDPPRVRIRALAGLAQRRMLHGRYREARALAHEAVLEARAAGLRGLEGHALNTLGFSLAAMGHGSEGLPHLDEAHAIALDLDDPDSLARAIENRGDSLHLSGYPDLGLAQHIEGIELVAERGLSLSYGPRFRYCAVDYAFETGEWELASRLLAEADRLADGSAGTRLNRASYVLRFLAARGSVSARAEWEQLRAQLAERPVTDLTGWIHIAAVELETLAGRTEEAIETAWASFESLATWDSWLWTAETARVAAWPVADEGIRARVAGDDAAFATREQEMQRLSELVTDSLAGIGDPDARIADILQLDTRQIEAERSRMTGQHDHAAWRDVADGWERVGRPYRSLIARWRQAEALALAEDRDAAWELLRTVHPAASRLGAQPLVERTELMARRFRLRLDAVAGDGLERGAAPFGLTEREREVLALIASGRTNRQIADELFIAKSTAGVHVSHILSKMGVATRTEAAAMAVSEELVPQPRR